MRKVLKFWSVIIGIVSIGLCAYGLSREDTNNIYTQIGLSLFTGWLVSFLVDILPTSLKECRAMKFVLPKVIDILYEIDKIDAILCFYVNISPNNSLDVKGNRIRHIVCLKSSYRVNRSITNVENQIIRLNDIITVQEIDLAEKKIKSNIEEIEKFWAYLPLYICESLTLIEENLTIYSACSLQAFMKYHNKEIDNNFDNMVILKYYKTIMQERIRLSKLQKQKKIYEINLDNRTEEERKKLINDTLLKSGENNK